MKPGSTILTTVYTSPAGTLQLGATDDRLCLCDWLSRTNRHTVSQRLERLLGARFAEGASAVTAGAARQLDEYFAGRRHTFSIPLLTAGSEFQQRIWQLLTGIPYGTVLSYKDIAEAIGNPRGARAVAGAINHNALSIFIPCHRVVGADGAPTGYAGGIPAKLALLELERANRQYHSIFNITS